MAKKATPAEELAAKKAAKPAKVTPARQDGVLICKCRELRQSLKLTIADVVMATRISAAGYHAIEQGCETTITTARKLSVFFGMPIDELWPAK